MLVCGALNAEVPGNRQEQQSDLDCVFVRNMLVFVPDPLGSPGY